MDSKLRARFERSVDRTGEHHLWTGATDPGRGTGKIKVEGKTTTPHRAAWLLEHGSPPVVRIGDQTTNAAGHGESLLNLLPLATC
jgi:hypothetical protein